MKILDLTSILIYRLLDVKECAAAVITYPPPPTTDQTTPFQGIASKDVKVYKHLVKYATLQSELV